MSVPPPAQETLEQDDEGLADSCTPVTLAPPIAPLAIPVPDDREDAVQRFVTTAAKEMPTERVERLEAGTQAFLVLSRKFMAAAAG